MVEASEFFKLNVDGSRTSHGIIGTVAVIRNCNGEWINGFCHHIGSGEVLQAEVWGIFIGLKLASSLQIRLLEVESDSAVAVSLIKSENQDFHPMVTLLTTAKF